MTRRLLCLVLWLFGAQALAEACPPASDVLELATLGVATFGHLRYSSREDRAELYGGVCVQGTVGEAGVGWVLRAERLEATDISTTPTLRANEVVLSVQGWRLEADKLVSEGESLSLTTLRFNKDEVAGTALEAELALMTGEMRLIGVSAGDGRYRVSGAEAVLAGDRLVFKDALATTCICEGGELYVVASPEASLDLVRERMTLQQGVLRIGSLEIALGEELELSEEALADLQFPLSLEYVPDDPVTSQRGSGLGLVASRLQAGEGVSLEVGLTGLDLEYPLSGILLLRIERPGVEVTIGKAREGFRADVSVTERLSDGLSFTFGIRNRPYAAQDFLHEGFVALALERQLRDLWPGDALTLQGRLLAAASSQQLDGTSVLGPRLSAQVGASYRAPASPLGLFSLQLGLGHSVYPLHERSQTAFRLEPRWRYSHGPLSAELAWIRQWVAGSSPFSLQLDRLQPESRLEARGRLAGGLSADSEGALELLLRVDTLAFAATALRLKAEATALHNGWTLNPHVEVELSGLLSPVHPVSKREQLAYVQLGVEASRDAWAFGFLNRYDLRPHGSGLERFETSGTLVFKASETVTLYPFVALDFAPTLLGGEPPLVSGHGLKLEWRSCCGTVLLGYRQYENRFATSFGVNLNGER
jgi:hypothetical protein